MKLQRAMQESLLALLCYDEENGPVASAMLQKKDFDPVFKEVAELALDYWERFGIPPGTHTLDIFNTAAERDESRAPLFQDLFESVEGLFSSDSFNPEYTLDCASSFVRYQRLMGGIQGALHDLNRGDLEGLTAAEAKLVTAMDQTAIAFDPGSTFIDDMDATLEFLTNPEEALPTGMPEFDKRNLGPCAGRFHLYIAESGKGKTWWLIHLAVCAMKRAKNVLYVSLEMGEKEVHSRLVQRVLSVSKRKAEDIEWSQFIDTRDPADSGSRTRTVTMGERPAFSDAGIEKKLRKKLRRLGGMGRIIVKGFPQGTLSVDGLDDYLTILEGRENFIPDLILVDYTDIMKRPDNLSGWEGLIALTTGLRRIAQMRHVAMASVSQVKASASGSKQVDVADVSGAWDKIATTDTVFTYSQTEEEARMNLARIFVAKARADEARFSVMISQAYAVGQFVLDSTYMGRNYNQDAEEGK